MRKMQNQGAPRTLIAPEMALGIQNSQEVDEWIVGQQRIDEEQTRQRIRLGLCSLSYNFLRIKTTARAPASKLNTFLKQ